MTDTDRRRAPAPSSTRRGLQLSATVSVLVVLWLFVTAGQMFPRAEGPAQLHSWGAILLHVATGLTVLAAARYRWVAGGPVWPTVLAVAVFALSFGQAWFGAYPDLYLHIPGALLLAVGSVWLVAWSFTGAPAMRRA